MPVFQVHIKARIFYHVSRALARSAILVLPAVLAFNATRGAGDKPPYTYVIRVVPNLGALSSTRASSAAPLARAPLK